MKFGFSAQNICVINTLKKRQEVELELWRFSEEDGEEHLKVRLRRFGQSEEKP